MYIAQCRVTKRLGGIDIGESVKFFGEETTKRLRDGVIVGAINKHGSLVFRRSNPC